MVPKAHKIRARRGMSLVGALVAVVILLIALIGTSTLRYSAALDGRRADAHITAAKAPPSRCASRRGRPGVENPLTLSPTACG